MKLIELLSNYKQVLKSKWDLPDNISEFLKKNNFNLISSNATFSQVWAEPSKKLVIKIGLKPREDCFLDFITMVKQNPNKHFPKLGKLRYFKHDNQEFFLIPIERLKSLDINHDPAFFYENMPLQCYIYKKDPNSLSAKQLITAYIKSDYRLLEKLKIKETELWQYFDDSKEIMDWVTDNAHRLLITEKELVKAINIVVAHKNKCDLDLHSGNFMVRNNKILVITDPLSFYKPGESFNG